MKPHVADSSEKIEPRALLVYTESGDEIKSKKRKKRKKRKENKKSEKKNRQRYLESDFHRRDPLGVPLNHAIRDARW
jgi:hypothetical protein